MLIGEATNSEFQIFGLTRPGLKLTIYRTQVENTNLYTTDAVYFISIITVVLRWFLYLNFQLIMVLACLNLHFQLIVDVEIELLAISWFWNLDFQLYHDFRTWTSSFIMVLEPELPAFVMVLESELPAHYGS